MLTDILLTLPIFLLFLLIAARCLGVGSAPEECEAKTLFSPGRRELMRVFGYAVLFRLFMLLVMFLCSMIFGGENGLAGFPGQFTRWDGRHYINLIDKGYTGYIEDGKHLFLVFYPLYVWVSRLVRLVIPSTIVSGLTVSVPWAAAMCTA